MHKEVAGDIKHLEQKYDLVIMRGDFPDVYIFLAFYNKWDPAWLQSNVTRFPSDTFGFSHPQKAGKYIFSGAGSSDYICKKEYRDKQILYISDQREDIPFVKEYFNFSGVHVQARLYDLGEVREQLRKIDTLHSFCGESFVSESE